MADIGLTTSDAASAWLGVPSGVDDARIARIAGAVSAAIERWLGYAVRARSYTRTFSGRGGTMQALPDRPVTAIASLTIDGVAVPPGHAGFVFDEDAVYLAGAGRFARGALNVAVAYTAGWTIVPPDIEQACLEWLKASYELVADDDRQTGVTMLKAGDTEKRFSATDGLLTDLGSAGIVAIPPGAYALLAPYRRVVPC